jgi:hypothetical protein
MNLRPKFLFRKSPKSLTEPPEQLFEEENRSESSFSLVSPPSSPPQSTHDPPTEIAPRASVDMTGGDGMYKDAALLLSRYKDVFNHNPEFQHLEERMRK